MNSLIVRRLALGQRASTVLLRRLLPRLPPQNLTTRRILSSRAFSLTRRKPFEAPRLLLQKNAPKHHEIHQLPKFSFDSLGASPRVKKVIIGVALVLGTCETYFYSRWLYEWWVRKYGSQRVEGDEDSD